MSGTASIVAPTRVLAIGLDGADPRLLLRWIDDGTMPCLAALRREGAWCELSTPPGLGDDAVWGSISTGVSPGRHARYFFRAIVSGTYDTPYKDASWLKREPFWSTLAQRGCRVAVLDAPKSALAREPNVVQIADWRCHGRSALPAANPPALADEIIARFGDDTTDAIDGEHRSCFKRALPASDLEVFLAELEKSVERKLAATEWLLARGDWDLFISVFKEAHCVGHQCWSDEAAATGPMRRIYRRLDEALGSLVRSVPAATPILVFSGLAMGANHSGNHLLPAVLAKLEPYVTPRRVALRQTMRRFHLPRAHGEASAHREHATRVIYAVDHNEASGAIRVNVRGREPRGIVRRGGELDAVCARLRDLLLGLTDADDGRAIVERVIRCAHVYAGEHVDELPDLLVVWRRDAPIRGARSAEVGEVRAPPLHLRPGNHTEGGILFARGAGIPRGVALPRAGIVDIAPTLASLLGTLLDDVDGHAITGLTGRVGRDGDRATL